MPVIQSITLDLVQAVAWAAASQVVDRAMSKVEKCEILAALYSMISLDTLEQRLKCASRFV